MHVVIVGNGIAGTEAALQLARAGVRVTQISEESERCFARTAMMWVAAGQLRYQDMLPFPEAALAPVQRLRARVEHVDVQARQLVLAAGAGTVGFDRLLLATGSRPRKLTVPGAALLGVGHFVTLQDLVWLSRELRGKDAGPEDFARLPAGLPADSPYARRPAASERRGRPARTVAVVGAGLLGCEAVEVALHHGCAVRFVMRHRHVFSSALLPEEARMLSSLLTAHGVHVEHSTELQRFEEDGHGCLGAIVTGAGRSACEAAVVAIGVEPNTAFLTGSGLPFGPRDGLRVNDRLETPVAGIFAAGDCAAVPDAAGQLRVQQTWYTARDQGRIAARAILGEPAQYDPGLPYDSAKMMDVEFTSVGALDAPAADAYALHIETGAVHSTTRFALREGRLVGFAGLGRRWDHSVVAEFIAARQTLPEVLTRLPEAAFDTEFVPPLQVPRDLQTQPLRAPREEGQG